jgi:hypothetical protein
MRIRAAAAVYARSETGPVALAGDIYVELFAALAHALSFKCCS